MILSNQLLFLTKFRIRLATATKHIKFSREFFFLNQAAGLLHIFRQKVPTIGEKQSFFFFSVLLKEGLTGVYKSIGKDLHADRQMTSRVS